ncbi:MAG: flagellar export chaperone FlgN [Parachlamydiales bacterium]|nr:flagellar export chaperone FlgN [Parachlamydiales bacterium]
MSSDESPNNQAIFEAQDHGIYFLDQEVKLMREVLANMHEEQQAILNRDEKTMEDVMSRRTVLYKNITSVRNERMQAMEQLAILLLSNKNADLLFDEKLGLGVLLSARGVDSCEILNLRDQMVAIVEKMNQQICRNHDLVKHHISYFPDALQYYTQVQAPKTPTKLLLTDEN